MEGSAKAWWNSAKKELCRLSKFLPARKNKKRRGEEKMSKFRVVWEIQLEKEFEVNSRKAAIIEAEDTDPQYDGNYVSDSFVIVKVEKRE